MAPKVLLFGSGSVGTIYVHLLLKAGCDVTAICRSNYTAAKENGFTINSVVYGDNIKIHPKVARTPSEAASEGPYDYLLVTCKALPEAQTASVIAPAVTKGHTTIVLIQNGIAIEEEYASQFPSNPLLSCVVYLPVTQTSPGCIAMHGPEQLEVGTYPPSPTSESAERLVALLNSAGGNATFYEDIQPQRWKKLLLNASWNPLSALTLCRDTAFLATSSFSESTFRGILHEIATIAQALGFHSITPEAADEIFKMTTARASKIGVQPSMLADQLASPRPRPLEVEVILGNPLRIARQKCPQVECPRLEMLYTLTKALDEANRYRKPGQSLDGEDLQRKADSEAKAK